MQRFSVIGSSCSGKTTIARAIATQLDIPRLELDSVFHQPGWTELADDEFRRRVSEFIEADSWVVDGNYTSHGVADIVWGNADAIIWPDLPKRTAMRRVLGRSIKRVATREELWNGNREDWSKLVSRDPLENIVLWVWTHFDHTREKYERLHSSGAWDDVAVFRLRSPAEVQTFLAAELSSAGDQW